MEIAFHSLNPSGVIAAYYGEHRRDSHDITRSSREAGGRPRLSCRAESGTNIKHIIVPLLYTPTPTTPPEDCYPVIVHLTGHRALPSPPLHPRKPGTRSLGRSAEGSLFPVIILDTTLPAADDHLCCFTCLFRSHEVLMGGSSGQNNAIVRQIGVGSVCIQRVGDV